MIPLILVAFAIQLLLVVFAITLLLVVFAITLKRKCIVDCNLQRTHCALRSGGRGCLRNMVPGNIAVILISK